MKILIVDDEANARYALGKAVQRAGREIIEAENGVRALEQFALHTPDLMFLDLQMPELDGHGVLAQLHQTRGDVACEIIVLTANDSIANAIECIRRGASDFLAKPYDIDHVRAIVQRSEHRVRLERRVSDLTEQAAQANRLGSLIGSSTAMKRLFSQIPKAARSHLPILIRGESGTGKELVAKELHLHSDRCNGPFVAVNTAAIADNLVESELFGHVRGAFTGADRPRDGVFRKADGGTLFLDEIGDMPPAIQTRLLRVVQEGIVQPVGSEDNIHVDVRIVSATHQDLDEQIQQRLFRQDLYFRLRGIELWLPPLRDRGDDVLLLMRQFVTHGHELSRDAMVAALAHKWPGNVRELKQRVESAIAMCEGEIVSATDLGLSRKASEDTSNNFDPYLDLPLTEAKTLLIQDFERRAISRALLSESNNVSAAARRLGIHRQSLQQKMKELGISSASDV